MKERFDDNDYESLSDNLKNILNNTEIINETEKKNFSSVFAYAVCAHIINDNSREFEEYFRKVSNVNENYENILNKTRLLAKELNLSTALEYCNLFTYLLWNGYLSKDNSLVFCSQDRMMLPNAYSYDIMNGKGVCFNFSIGLRDFLNGTDFSSSSIINKFPNDLKKDYDILIQRNIKSDKIIFRSMLKLLKPISKRVGNHAFNLVSDDNSFYIYDPTNILIGKIENDKKGQMIEGTGIFELNPYFSFMYNTDEKAVELLEKLIKSESYDYECPLKYSDAWYSNVEKFKETKLLNDFHEDINNDITKIADISNVSKSLKKQYNKERKNKLKTQRK